MIYTCCNENRKNAILGSSSASTPNGIDYLELLSRPSRNRLRLQRC